MNRNLIITAMALLAGSLLAADSNSKEQVTAAAKKLAEKPNYTWKTTVVVPEGTNFRPGPTEGKTEKGGFTHVKMTFRENTTQIVLKGDKGAVSNRDGGWDSLSELENSEGRGRFMALMARGIKAPAAQAEDLAGGAKEIKKEGDAYVGELKEDTVKELVRFRRGSEGPAVTNPKGSVKFWLTDGALSKYEFKVSGKMTFNENEMDIDRTTTVEIKDVGATKMDIPEEAKKKVS